MPASPEAPGAELAQLESPVRAALRSVRRRDVGITLAVGFAILAVVLLVEGPQQTTETSQAVSVAGEAKGPAPAIGQPAPDFEVQGLDGKLVRLSDLRGKPVWINFFATWCPPCRAETPDLQAAYADAQSGGKDLVLLALDMGEDAAIVRDYVQRLGMSYPVGLDRDFAVSAEYRVRGLPSHVFVDRQGIVRAIRVSILTPAMIRQELEKIL